MRVVATSLLFLLILAFSCNSADKSKIITSVGEYRKVVKVVDGDTFYLDDGSSTGEKIRLIGIDAPESKNVFKKKQGFYGKEAKDYLTGLLEGQKVKLEYDIRLLDQYRRTLAYVYLEDSTFVNAELVKNGFAMVMTVHPNVKYADEFVKLQQEARDNKKGLWGLQH